MCRILYFCLLFYLLFNLCCSTGWSDITMQCRDFENNPVDWWFIYKPPGDNSSFLNDGSHFTYITSDDANQRWRNSKLYITGSGMLLNTLAPLYRKTYLHRIAVVKYTSKEGVSSGRGLMLADTSSGLWLQHSVPGFPLFSSYRNSFPQSEITYGHSLSCITLDIKSLNTLADIIKKVRLNVTHQYVPKGLRKTLSHWNFRDKIKKSETGIFKSTLTGKGGHEWIVFYREFGTKKCLFNTFAKTYDIVLDVYTGRGNDTKTYVCKNEYGTRLIKNIAVTAIGMDNPIYINQDRDRMRFAVSTAAVWQKTIHKTHPQYWTCISEVDQLDTAGLGGMLTCINNYKIWRSFDNFKIAEPQCTN